MRRRGKALTHIKLSPDIFVNTKYPEAKNLLGLANSGPLQETTGRNTKLALNVKFTQNLVLFGTEIDIKTDTVFDLVILQAKQFIYKCKLDKCLPTLSCFLQQLMLKYKIDEYNAKISGELPTFILNWICYKPILKTEN